MITAEIEMRLTARTRRRITLDQIQLTNVQQLQYSICLICERFIYVTHKRCFFASSCSSYNLKGCNSEMCRVAQDASIRLGENSDSTARDGKSNAMEKFRGGYPVRKSLITTFQHLLRS